MALLTQRKVLQKVKSTLGAAYHDTETCEEKIDSLECDVSGTSTETIPIIKDYIEVLQINCQYIQTTIKEFESEAESAADGTELSIRTELAKVNSENDQLKIKIKYLETKLAKIEKELGEMIEMKDKLALGQVAWIFEQEVAKYVLPESERGNIGDIGAYGYMEWWLTENMGTDQGIEAKKRLDELKDKVNWSERNHKKALKLLKELRKDLAHPSDVDLDEAKKQVPQFVSAWRRKECIDIISMIENTRVKT